MSHRASSILFAGFLAAFPFMSLPAAAQQPCESLKSIKIPNLTITSVTAGSPDLNCRLKPAPWEKCLPGRSRPHFAESRPIPRRRAIRISASRCGFPSHPIGTENFWPQATPGFIGSLSSSGLADIMQRGYVAAGTDTGHVDAGFEWAIGHPEKWADWGYRAVHEMAVVTKKLAESYYGKPIQYSYWNSCHNGGNQGLNEAQRYPDDFDGIVAGDPAYPYIAPATGISVYQLGGSQRRSEWPRLYPARKDCSVE